MSIVDLNRICNVYGVCLETMSSRYAAPRVWHTDVSFCVLSSIAKDSTAVAKTTRLANEVRVSKNR